jgi:hypothetical protein
MDQVQRISKKISGDSHSFAVELNDIIFCAYWPDLID